MQCQVSFLDFDKFKILINKILKLVRNGRHDGLFEVLGLDDVGLRPGCLVPRLGGDVAADATLFCRLQGHHY